MSVAETVVATEVINSSVVIEADEVIHKNYIRQVQLRVKHNIFFLQNQIQALETQLGQQQAQLDILCEILGEIPESSEEDSEEEYETDNSEEIDEVENNTE